VPVERVGLRPGEKFYEELITDHELTRCLETERLLIVLPYLEGWKVHTEADAHKPGPDDYPDGPRWARQPFSSRTATPLSRAAVRRLLERHRAGAASAPAGGRP
jgi:hypothetical protein